jgi:hypothetical protein
MAEATKETGKAKKALEEYLLLGPGRSLAKLAKAMGKADSYVALLERWSTAHSWQEKAKEYDKEQAAARRAEIEEARREMDREHAKWGHEQALLAIKTIQGLIGEGKYNPAAANQLFKIATGLQRLALGSSTEQIALTGKDGDPLVDVETIVETFWGRGTDPRRKDRNADPIEKEEPADQREEDDEDLDEDEEFGAEVPEDDD